MSLVIKNQTINLSTSLEQDYEFVFSNKLPEFSSPLSEAIEIKPRQGKDAEEKFYALIFKKDFPVDFVRLNIHREMKLKFVQELSDFGKIKTPQGKEVLAAVLKRPRGIRLSKYIFEMGNPNDHVVITNILTQLFNGILALHENRLTHGSINADNIFINPENFAITIKECVSEYCGFSQKMAFETYERMACHPAGKNYVDQPADYYALGMMLVSLLTGEPLFEGLSEDTVIKTKFEGGSYESVLNIIRSKKVLSLSVKNENLLKGLLHDKTIERWGNEQIKKWQKREISQGVPSKVHRQTSTSFIFEDRDYLSAKYLAYAIQKNWAAAKKHLKVLDLSRWITFTSKFSDIEKRIFLMTNGWQSEIVIPDEKLSRILNLLDEEGPIRMRNTCFHPRATGNIFVHFLNENNQTGIDDILAVFDLGLIEAWISQQDDAEMYKPSILGWNPRKIKHYLRMREVGFGVERCAYELNSYLACKSPLLENFYCVGLVALIKDLEKIKLPSADKIDKHLVAYLATHCKVEDTIKVKTLAHFPDLIINEDIKMCALLSIAQKMSGLGSLPNLTRWAREKLDIVLKKVYSNKIRTELEERLNKSVASGDIDKLFHVIADSKLLKRDFNGFREARNQYKMLSFEIFRLRSKANLDQMSYKLGLRAALIFSYLVSSVSILTIMLITMR